MEIIRNLSKQSFPAGSGRVTLKNSLRDYLHLLKSPDFKLLVLKCAGSYSRVLLYKDCIQSDLNVVLERYFNCNKRRKINCIYAVKTVLYTLGKKPMLD